MNNLINIIDRAARTSRHNQEAIKNIKLTLEELEVIALESCRPYREQLGDDFEQVLENIRDNLTNDGTRTVGKSISADDHKLKPWVRSRLDSTETPYWNIYKEELKGEFAAEVSQSTDKETTDILDRIGNPLDKSFDKRGLVMGSVQMGKTMNYIGLISKAADFGYRFIIIIAGATNNLRTQTQKRVDEGFTRVDSGSSQRMTPEVYGNQPMSLTNLVNDFNAVKKEDSFNLSQSDRPYVAVVKKNGPVLKNLLEWIVNAHFLAGHTKSNPTQNGPLDLPLLLIDDEADYASVNTAKDPKKMTRINETIRKILSKFSKSSYIGYTATPFANIFIDPYKLDNKDVVGDDLFPKNFIYKLGLPSNYMGPDIFFGDTPNADLLIDLSYKEGETMFDLINVDKSDKDNPIHEVYGITDQLKEAVRNFVLVVVERKLRGHLTKHNTMMINFQYLTVLQDLLKGHIKSYLDELVHSCVAYYKLPLDRAKKDENIKDLLNTYKKEFIDKRASYKSESRSFEEILKNLKLVETIEILSVHYKSRDRLSYDEYSEGRNVIAIGGFSLSRGLTLEGLSISFLDRNTQNSDTLLQMGRWFGYRDGYDDLIRLYVDWQSRNFFEESTETINELYEELDFIHEMGLSPLDFGLKVRQHPSSLRITAINKMRSADIRSWLISYWGRRYQSINLFKETSTNLENLFLTKGFITKIGDNFKKAKHSYIWNSVNKDLIIDFIKAFKDAPRKDSQDTHVRKFLEDLGDHFDEWNVLLVSNKSSTKDVTLLRGGDALEPILFNKVKVNAQARIFVDQDNYLEGRNSAISASSVEELLLNESEVNDLDKTFEDLKEAFSKNEESSKPGKYNILRKNFLKKPSLIIHTLVANMDEKKEITDKAAKRILCNKELDVHIAFSISFPGKLPNGSMPKTSDKKYALTTTMQRDVDNSDYNEELEEDEE